VDEVPEAHILERSIKSKHTRRHDKKQRHARAAMATPGGSSWRRNGVKLALVPVTPRRAAGGATADRWRCDAARRIGGASQATRRHAAKSPRRRGETCWGRSSSMRRRGARSGDRVRCDGAGRPGLGSRSKCGRPCHTRWAPPPLPPHRKALPSSRTSHPHTDLPPTPPPQQRTHVHPERRRGCNPARWATRASPVVAAAARGAA